MVGADAVAARVSVGERNEGDQEVTQPRAARATVTSDGVRGNGRGPRA